MRLHRTYEPLYVKDIKGTKILSKNLYHGSTIINNRFYGTKWITLIKKGKNDTS